MKCLGHALAIVLTLVFVALGGMPVMAEAATNLWTFTADWRNPEPLQLNGPWQVEDGLLTLPQVTGAKVNFPFMLGDFELTMRYMVHGYGTYGALTLHLREAEPWETYAVRLHEYGITATRRHGTWADYMTLADTVPAPAQGVWHDLRVVAEGSTIEVWVDGTRRLTFTDRDGLYPAGGIIFDLSNISVSIDSVTVQAATPPPHLPPREVELPIDRPIPPTGRITGTFLQVDSSNVLRPYSAWNSEFNFMQRIGIDTFIASQVVADNGTVFPVVRTLLDQGERTGITVYLGIPGFGGYEWTQSPADEIDRQIARAKAAIDAIYEQYGEHPAFGGWYLDNEIDEKDLIPTRYDVTERYYRELTQYAHSLTPDLPVIVAPSFEGGTSPNWYASKWKTLLERTGIDILAVQDSVGAKRSVPELNPHMYAALRKVTDELGVMLWADVEIFDIDTWEPAAIDLVHRQLQAVADYVDKTVVFEFHRYMNPLRSIYAGDLYHGYRELIGAE